MSKHKARIVNRDLTENLNQVRQEFVPGNVFQREGESIPVKISKKEFARLYREVGESGVAYLSLDKAEIPTMIEEVQWHPVREGALHVLFRAIDLTQKTEAFIPVELAGEFELPEAVLVTVRDEIEVEALPTDLPEKFVVSVDGLSEIGQSITLADLDYDRDKITVLLGEEGEEAPIVLVQEVEEEPEEPEEIETEIIGEEDEGEDGEDAEGEEGEPAQEESEESGESEE